MSNPCHFARLWGILSPLRGMFRRLPGRGDRGHYVLGAGFLFPPVAFGGEARLFRESTP
jgi:hypothetical protein